MPTCRQGAASGRVSAVRNLGFILGAMAAAGVQGCVRAWSIVGFYVEKEG